MIRPRKAARGRERASGSKSTGVSFVMRSSRGILGGQAGPEVAGAVLDPQQVGVGVEVADGTRRRAGSWRVSTPAGPGRIRTARPLADAPGSPGSRPIERAVSSCGAERRRTLRSPSVARPRRPTSRSRGTSGRPRRAGRRSARRCPSSVRAKPPTAGLGRLVVGHPEPVADQLHEFDRRRPRRPPSSASGEARAGSRFRVPGRTVRVVSETAGVADLALVPGHLQGAGQSRMKKWRLPPPTANPDAGRRARPTGRGRGRDGRARAAPVPSQRYGGGEPGDRPPKFIRLDFGRFALLIPADCLAAGVNGAREGGLAAGRAVLDQHLPAGAGALEPLRPARLVSHRIEPVARPFRGSPEDGAGSGQEEGRESDGLATVQVDVDQSPAGRAQPHADAGDVRRLGRPLELLEHLLGRPRGQALPRRVDGLFRARLEDEGRPAPPVVVERGLSDFFDAGVDAVGRPSVRGGHGVAPNVTASRASPGAPGGSGRERPSWARRPPGSPGGPREGRPWPAQDGPVASPRSHVC